MSQTPVFQKVPINVRSDRYDFVLGRSVTSKDLIFPGNRLPSEENVLRAFIYSKEQHLKDALPAQHKNIHQRSAHETIALIKKVYIKAGIPTLSERQMSKQIFKLHNKYKNLLKIPSKRRTTQSVQSSIKEFQLKLQNTTLPCWDSKAKLLKEDQDFVNNMKTDRTFTRRDSLLPSAEMIDNIDTTRGKANRIKNVLI